MPRAKRILQEHYPYHVSLRGIGRNPFPMEMPRLWRFSSDLLLFCSRAFNVEIHSFVLMTNHYHMLVRTPDCNLSKFMNYFNRELSREITYASGRINQKFGARYHASIIWQTRYYHSVYKYVYRNPVRAGLCERVEDYPYSSLNFLLGRERYLFPVYETYFEKVEDHLNNLNWLNTPFENEALKGIQLGFKKTYFDGQFIKAAVPATSQIRILR